MSVVVVVLRCGGGVCIGVEVACVTVALGAQVHCRVRECGRIEVRTCDLCDILANEIM